MRSSRSTRAGRSARCDAYRIALGALRPLLRAIALFVVAWIAPHRDRVPDSRRDLARRPLVPARAGRRARGRASAYAALRRSAAPRPRPLDPGRLARRRQRRGRARGRPAPRRRSDLPHELPFALLNLVAGLVYALLLPYVAIVTAYVYFDARARIELEPAEQPRELPAEIELGPA